MLTTRNLAALAFVAFAAAAIGGCASADSTPDGPNGTIVVSGVDLDDDFDLEYDD